MSSSSSDYHELAAKYELLQKRYNEQEATLKIVSKIVLHHRSVWERARAFQTAASLARQGGPHGHKVIGEIESRFPIAYDLSNLVDELVEAVGKKKLPGV